MRLYSKLASNFLLFFLNYVIKILKFFLIFLIIFFYLLLEKKKNECIIKLFSFFKIYFFWKRKLKETHILLQTPISFYYWLHVIIELCFVLFYLKQNQNVNIIQVYFSFHFFSPPLNICRYVYLFIV